MLPLIEKYRAKIFAEIKGQDETLNEIDVFYKKFPEKKAIILNGPVGTGKTSMAIALANEYNLELFELNASDLRNRLKLDEVLKPVTAQQSLFKKSKLILVDEADGMTADDKGGLPELIKLINQSSFPIIITSNNIYDKKFSELRKICNIINVKELNENIVLKIIQNIVLKENKQINQQTLFEIAKKARGDVRAALNDLQSIMHTDLEIKEKRDKTQNIFYALKRVFQNPTSHEIIESFDDIDMQLDEILLWIEENIPQIYQGHALAKAMDSLSKADLFKGRIYRQQYWRFLIYQNFFLSAGISSASKLKPNNFIRYKRPTRILKIWLSNQKNINKKSILRKYARQCHCSKKKASKEAFLLPFIINQQAQKKLDLNEKETEWIKNKKADIIILNNLNKFRS